MNALISKLCLGNLASLTCGKVGQERAAFAQIHFENVAHSQGICFPVMQQQCTAQRVGDILHAVACKVEDPTGFETPEDVLFVHPAIAEPDTVEILGCEEGLYRLDFLDRASQKGAVWRVSYGY